MPELLFLLTIKFRTLYTLKHRRIIAAAAANILKMFLREPALCADLAIVEELR